MKKFEHKTKNERRRVLLSKNNVKYTLSKDKVNNNYPNNVNSGDATGAAATSSVLAKVQGMNRRVLAIVLAVAMVLTVISVGAVWLTKAAETKVYFTELDSTNPQENTPLTQTYNPGTVYYYYQPEERTYTYTLNETLVPGDTITFDSDSKEISWIHDASAVAETAGYTNVVTDTNSIMSEDSAEGGVYTLSLESEKTLTNTPTYYYEAPNGDTFAFAVSGFVGYQESDKASASNPDTRDYYLKGHPLKEGVNVQITIDASNIEGTNATLSGNQLTRHYIYVPQTSPINTSNGKIYLVAADTGVLSRALVKYSTQGTYGTDTLADRGWAAFADCEFRFRITGGGSHYHTQYETTPERIGLEDQDIYDIQGNVLDNSYYPYINGENNGTFLYLNEEFLSEDADSGYFYLKGNNGTVFTRDMVFGKIGSTYSDSKYRNAYVYDICMNESHNQAAMWTYDGSSLSIKTDFVDSTTKRTKLVYTDSSNHFSFATNNPSTVYLYELVNAYDKAPVTETVSITAVDQDASGVLEATDVTYTDNSAVAGNYLEIDKTVKTVDKENGIYDITLEAYTTAPQLNLPATDIMLILDTSKNMTTKLYDRDYTTLKTYEGFQKIDLSSGTLTHDALFDRDHPSGIGQAAIEAIADLFAQPRYYIHNHYVEDPNAPGTYVYLHQQYNYYVVYNRYQYYFTSVDGTTYSTSAFRQDIFSSGLDPAPLPSSGLVFTASGKPSVTRKEVYYLPNYSERDGDNISPATNGNLYSIANSSNHLYIKDNNGDMRRVFVYANQKAGGVAEPGMYRYVVYVNDVENGTVQYEFCTGNSQTLNNETTEAADYGVFQGFRHYKTKDGNLVLDDSYDNLIDKTLYTKKPESVTALQAMKESMTSFLLNAHKQVVEKGAEVYVGLVAYDKGAELQYGLATNSGKSYTNLAKLVGNNSVDTMISTIGNYTVEEYRDSANNLHRYNVISDNVEHTQDWFNAFTGTYAAEVDAGLTVAKNELATNNHNKENTETHETIESRRFAVLFTAGVPAEWTTNLFGADRSGTFTTDTADRAISTAYDIKNSLKTTFYTVGMFDNANETKINGDYWYYQWSDKVYCDGNTGSYWGGSWVINGFNNIDPKDAYATNRMLAYISSDYSTPKSLGVTRGSYHPGKRGLFSFLASGTGYRIDQNFTRDDTGFYLSVSPNSFEESSSTEEQDSYVTPTSDVESILNAVFAKLEIATSSPKNSLDINSFLVDGITDYFDLVVDDEDHMPTAKVMDASDVPDNEFSLNLKYDDENTPSATTKTISVTGFDYSRYYMSDNNPDKQRKVVLTFRVQRTDGLIGGNSIPTNLSKTAIYDGDASSITNITPWGIMEERFEIPKVDLPIRMSHFTKDASIYYGGTQDLVDSLNFIDLEEIELAGNNGTLIPNEFVTVKYTIKDTSGLIDNTVNTYTVPVGATSGTWEHPIQDEAEQDGTPGEIHNDNFSKIFVSPDASTKYTIEVEVIPVSNGTVKTKTYKDTNDNDAYVYVFTPHYVTYNGTVESAGDEYNLTVFTEDEKTPQLTEWTFDEEIAPRENGATPESLLKPDQMPTITFDLNQYEHPNTLTPKEGTLEDTFTVSNNNVSQTAKSIVEGQDLSKYVVNDRVDLIMNNIQITAKSREYTVEQKVEYDYYDSIGVIYKSEFLDLDEKVIPAETIYYDSDGTVIDHRREAGTYTDENGNTVQITFNEDPEIVYGEVVKYYTPAAKNADQKTTFENDSDHREQVQDGKPGSSFTLSLNGHDVTITNTTQKNPNEPDYSDKNHEFDMTVTLTDGNNVAVSDNTEIKYVDLADQSQTEKTLTFTNGVATGLKLKHNQQVKLLNVPDGYNVTLTSDLADHYTVDYNSKVGTGDTVDHDVNPADEASDPVQINDEATINVIHTIKSVPTTGMGTSDFKINPFIIAAVIVAVLGGAWIAYIVKRKSQAAE